LDEPASDLDPRARIEVRDLLLELRELGKTIFLSSHILTELSDVCTSVGILEHGELVVSGPIGEIAERLAAGKRPSGAPDSFRGLGTAAEPLVTAGGAPIPEATRKRLKLRVLGESQLVVPMLAGGGGILDVAAGPGGQLVVQYVGGDAYVAEVVRYLVANGVGIVSIEPERNELERIFLEVTKGELQ
ncbi:MAG TPA: ABC transporter ATP-binding protein, partial [Polyangiaceae bacterium]|nr:ABC transporter ATP-binding protein [Polyangiaceae bacterium]